MRDIYLIDFENVASEGLSGITYLSEEDQVIIFYSNNSNRLSMKMHILIGKSVCQLSYFEVSVGGKNALDHQIATWLGYLIGTNAAERNYYIVSRDMGYKHVANFWASSAARAKVRCIENIRAAGRLERKVRERREERQQLETAQAEPSTEVQLPLVAVEKAAETVETDVQHVEETEVAVQPVETVAEAVVATEAAEVAATEETAVEAVAPENLLPLELSAEEIPETPDAQPESPMEAPVVQPIETPAEPVEVSAIEAPEQLQEEHSPEDKPEEPTPRRSYRSRTKFRRGRAKYRENQPEQTEAKPQELQEAPVTAEPEPETKKPQRGTKTQPKREKRPAKDEGKTPKNLDQLGPLLAPYPKLQESALRELILANKRQVLCNTLRKQLGQEKGLALYNEIKKMAWH